MTNEQIIEKLRTAVPQSIVRHEEFRGDLTVVVHATDIVRVAAFIKEEPDLAFDLVVDVLGVDMYRPVGRFEVVYNIFSVKNKRYLRLKVAVDENHPVVPTVTGVWPGANWHERETYDMFGVRFEGHPDLRRMYMPEEFDYHPLRKDFPLLGIPDSLPLPRR